MRTIELSISKGNVKAQIEAFLYQLGIVQDNEDVVSLSFDTKTLKSTDEEVIPLSIKLKRRLEVNRIVHG